MIQVSTHFNSTRSFFSVKSELKKTVPKVKAEPSITKQENLLANFNINESLLSTSTERLQTREYSSSTEDITSPKAESRQVSPPPNQWDSENEALSNRKFVNFKQSKNVKFSV